MDEQGRHPPRSFFLRATLLWGDFVVATQEIGTGESVQTSSATWSVPEQHKIPSTLVVGRASGWEVDATEADEVIARIGGVERSAVKGRLRLAAGGDAALLRFGPLAMTFHVEPRVETPPPLSVMDSLLAAGFGFAAVAVLGGLALVFAVTGAATADMPPALQRPDELARLYYVDASVLAATPPKTKTYTDPISPDQPEANNPVAAALRRRSPELLTDALSSHAIASVLLSRYEAIESCAPTAASTAQSPSVAKIEVTIAPSGTVQNVRFLGAGLGDNLVQCIGDQFRQFKFPSASASTKARFALRL